jgi:hypothetical protein
MEEIAGDDYEEKNSRKICIFCLGVCIWLLDIGMEDKNIKYFMKAHKLFRGTRYLVGRIDVPDIP